MKARDKTDNIVKISIVITLAVMAFIFIQSALPADLSSEESGWISGIVARVLGLDQDTASFLVRKAAHFTEFMILAICLGVNVAVYWKWKRDAQFGFWYIAIPAWLLATIYAITDEIHQMWVPGRACQVRDILIDAVGAVLGALIVAIAIIRKKR